MISNLRTAVVGMPIRRTSRRSTTVCHCWKQGRCTRDPCRFLHGDPPPQAPWTICTRRRRPNVYCGPDQTQKGNQALAPPSKTLPEEARVSKSADQVAAAVPAAATVQEESSAVVDIVVPSTPAVPVPEPVAAIFTPTFSKIWQQDGAVCCQDWMAGNCGRGGDCGLLHSWFRGDGFTMLTRLVDGDKKSITGIEFPARSDKLYSATGGGLVRAWDCNTGLLTGTMNVSDQEVGCMISDGDLVFIGFPNGVKAWNLKLAIFHDLTGPIGQVHALQFGVDALYAGAEDGGISVWKGSFTDLQQGNPAHLQLHQQPPATTLRGHGSAVTSMKFTITDEESSCPTKKLCSGSMDGTIKVWDLNTGECIQTLVNAHDEAVTSVIGWNEFLISGSLDRKVKFWSCITEGSRLLSLIHTHEEEGAAPLALGGLIGLEGKSILFCSWSNCTVGLYELPSLKELGRIYSQGAVRAIQSRQANGYFFTGDGNGVVSVWKWLAEAAPA